VLDAIARASRATAEFVGDQPFTRAEIAEALGCSVVVPIAAPSTSTVAELVGGRRRTITIVADAEIVDGDPELLRNRRIRRRLSRRRRHAERMQAERERWAEASKLPIDGKLPAAIAPETRSRCLAIVRDGRGERRRAIEACLRLPIGQAKILLAVRAREDFPRLVACALAQWATAHNAKPRSGCVRLVDGVWRGAYRFAVLRPDGRNWSRATLWKSGGPMLELEKLGIYERRQPPAWESDFKGPVRTCPKTGRQLQFACGQTRYYRSMCGRSLRVLADRGNREALAIVASVAPWLIDRTEERELGAELAAELAQLDASADVAEAAGEGVEAAPLAVAPSDADSRAPPS